MHADKGMDRNAGYVSSVDVGRPIGIATGGDPDRLDRGHPAGVRGDPGGPAVAVVRGRLDASGIDRPNQWVRGRPPPAWHGSERVRMPVMPSVLSLLMIGGVVPLYLPLV